jgi:hypothetical protein
VSRLNREIKNLIIISITQIFFEMSDEETVILENLKDTITVYREEINLINFQCLSLRAEAIEAENSKRHRSMIV